MISAVSGDLPENETDKTTEIDISHSVNTEDSEEVNKEKSGITLQPVSMTFY